MDNWVSTQLMLLLLLVVTNCAIGQQVTSTTVTAPPGSTAETTTLGNHIVPVYHPQTTTPNVTTTTTATTTTTTTVVPSTTTAPPTTTTTSPTTTTASEPLVLNGGLHPDDLARLLVASNNDHQEEQLHYEQQQQPQQLAYINPIYAQAFQQQEEEMIERMNEKRSATGSPSTIATYGSSVVNIPAVYGATYGQPGAAKGLGYNLGYDIGQRATYGGGGGGSGLSTTAIAGNNGGGGLLGGFGRLIQMVGSGIKNIFNLGGGGGGNYGGGGQSSGSVGGNGGLFAGKTAALSGVAQAGLSLKALGLGLGIGAIKGMIIGTKVGLIKGLILAKIKQSLTANALQQQQQTKGLYPSQLSYDETYRQDTSGYGYDGGYGPVDDQSMMTAYPKGDYDIAPAAGYADTYAGYGHGHGYGYGVVEQPPATQGPSTVYGNFPLGVVVGAVKGAKDGIVRGLFGAGDVLGKGQQQGYGPFATQRPVFQK